MRRALGPVNCFYPRLTVLVGAMVNGKPNYIAIAWIGVVSQNAVGIASQKGNYTNIGIRQHQTFSINIPSEALVSETDYCGRVSGRDADKSALFESVYGQLETAPMIASCPLSMECRVIQTLEFGSHELFIGEIIQTYASQEVMSGDTVDVAKVKPIFYEPCRHYWTLGQPLAGKVAQPTTSEFAR